jgi:hypothetical protein
MGLSKKVDFRQSGPRKLAASCTRMSRRPNHAPGPASVALDIAQRMRAHARLCHQIAVDSWDAHVADEFAKLASEFMQVATQIEDDCAVPRGRLH